MKILIVNGPNLNLLGTREPGIYGNRTMADCLAALRRRYDAVGVGVEYFQSNHEGDIIDKLQSAQAEGVGGIVLNAGGYTHTSVAIADAVSAIPVPVIEVHISNIFAREEERHVSLLSSACVGVIAGLGLKVYRLAIEALLSGDEIG